MTKYDDNYKWVKVKRHIDDPALDPLKRLEILSDHHIKETTFLVNEVRDLAYLLEKVLKEGQVSGNLLCEISAKIQPPE